MKPLDMDVYFIPGNHDTRDGMRQAVKDHSYLPDRGDYLQYVIEGFSIRLLGLDTTIPCKPRGSMCEERLAWLDKQIVKKPLNPTELFMHHPLIETGIEHMDVQICGNGEALGDLLEKHKQVFQIFCGHVHRPIHTQWRGVTVTIAPSASHYVALD